MNLNLIITERSDDFMVHLSEIPGKWDCGKTISEAIGNWIKTHGSDYGISLTFLHNETYH